MKRDTRLNLILFPPKQKKQKSCLYFYFNFSFIAKLLQFLNNIDEFHLGKQPMRPVLVFAYHSIQILKLRNVSSN